MYIYIYEDDSKKSNYILVVKLRNVQIEQKRLKLKVT